uniref:Transmembrane protein n=1 Tax=Marseillevirus LCMAC202 TaxID=2506606 RepID=A0A481YXN5_9VIRU|nr:MAG: hypothetical protein LCMAC202_02300 [Marseillevirus LCMAC202]
MILALSMALSMAFWFFYNKSLRKHNGDSFEFTIQVSTSYVSLKEYKNDCDDADFDGWSVLHVILYILMGMLFPGEYIIVLFLSIFSELWKYLSRWIVDPVVNLVTGLVVRSADLDFCKDTR